MKILVMTDNPNLPTGMGRVGKEIALALCRGGHEVVYIGWYKDIKDMQPWPFQLIAVDNHNYGETVFDKVVVSERPDVLLTIGDPWMYGYVADPLKCKTRRLFQWVGYVAVDGQALGGGLPQFSKTIINNMDRVVAYTEYGRKALVATLPDLEMSIDVIYHGVNLTTYHPRPVEVRERLRAQLGLSGRFVFLVVARNCGRKNIPELFKAWKKVVEQKMCPNAVVWPHMVFKDQMGVDIDELLETFELAHTKTVMFFEAVARSGSSTNMVSEDVLSSLYAVCDCLVSLGGEGFGLPILEAMATKLPVLCIDESASGELGAEGRAVLTKPSCFMTGVHLTERPIPDPTDVAEKMKQVYEMEDAVKSQMVEKAYNFATQFTWEAIGQQWLVYFDKLQHMTSYPLILQEVS